MNILKNTRKLSNEEFIKEIDPILYGTKYENKAIKINSKFMYTKKTNLFLLTF